jgi:uncharacterized membrane protein
MTTATLPTTKYRIESIDVLRGIVMIIMALDHVRDYIHIGANLDDPLNLATTTPLLFFTRWITHFCAPVFVFLSGTSIYLQSLRKTKKELSGFLIKRGLWLILLEFIVVTFGWSFNPAYNFLFFQVIWAIGISMVILGLLIYLPLRVILFLGLAIVFGHDLLDYAESAASYHHTFVMDLLHSGRFSAYPFLPHHVVLIIYPFLPWTGLMMIGYCTGIWFSSTVPAERRRKNLLLSGLGLILFFVIVRFSNLYGDPVPWSLQQNGRYTFFSFINVNKYPPSLLYLCITIGPSLLLLAYVEKFKNRFTQITSMYGRVALFYYVVHIYLVHVISAIFFLTRGHSFLEPASTSGKFPFYFLAPGEGYGLGMVYAVWICVILALYPLCEMYDRYKTNHRDMWWLSYL